MRHRIAIIMDGVLKPERVAEIELARTAAEEGLRQFILKEFAGDIDKLDVSVKFIETTAKTGECKAVLVCADGYAIQCTSGWGHDGGHEVREHGFKWGGQLMRCGHAWCDESCRKPGVMRD